MWLGRMLMANHAVWNPPTKLRDQSEALQEVEFALENDLENRINNLGKLVDSVSFALGQESFSGKPHALDLMNDLRVKIKATHNMLRVAKLLSEPARESMLSKVRDSLTDLEDVVASKLGVEMT
jgi:hypothetical protein